MTVSKSNKPKFDANPSKKASNNSKAKNARREEKELKKLITKSLDGFEEEMMDDEDWAYTPSHPNRG